MVSSAKRTAGSAFPGTVFNLLTIVSGDEIKPTTDGEDGVIGLLPGFYPWWA